MHFDEAGELAGGEFVAVAEGGEAVEGEERSGGDAGAGAFGEEGGGQGGGEGEEGEGGGGEEVGVVAVVAEVVEGFVGVFDGEFGAGGRVEEVGVDCLVEAGAVGVGLVGWEDEELGDAGAEGEGGEGERGGVGVCGFLRCWLGGGRCVGWKGKGQRCFAFGRGRSNGGRVGVETVGGAITDERVRRGGGRGQ